MKNRSKLIAIVIITGVVLAALFLYSFRKKIMSHFVPTIEQISDISVIIKNDTAIISSKLIVKNNSFIQIEIDTLKYKLTMFNKTYFQNTRFIGSTLKRYGTDTIILSIKEPYITLLKDLKAERKKVDSASYTINISINYSTALTKSEFPINKSAKLKIPHPPEIEIVDIEYTKIRWKSIEANAKIKIVNNSDVSLTVKNMNYSMTVAEQGHLNGSYKETIIIKPNETNFVNIPIIINLHNIGKTVFDVLMNRDQYSYTLKLDGILESTDPIKKSFTLDVTKSGVMELKK